MAITAEREEATRHHRGVVDRRIGADLEVAEEPPCRDACMAARVTLGDQDGQLEKLAERRSPEFAQHRFGDEEVAALDRTVERCSRMSLRCQRPAFPGPDGL